MFIIVDFALPNKGDSLLDTYHKWRARATNKVCCDYALHMGIASWSDEVNLNRFFYTKIIIIVFI